MQDTVLRAPRAGRLGERQIERGQISDPQAATPWFVLAADDDREFEAWVDVQRLEGFEPGQPVSIYLESAGLTPLHGQLRSVEAGQGLDARRARVRVSLPPGTRVPLGVSASASLSAAPRPGLALPPEALQFDPLPWVFVVDGHGQLRKRRVRLSADGQRVLEGLRPSERVVRNTAALLSEGQYVQAVLDAHAHRTGVTR